MFLIFHNVNSVSNPSVLYWPFILIKHIPYLSSVYSTSCASQNNIATKRMNIIRKSHLHGTSPSGRARIENPVYSWPEHQNYSSPTTRIPPERLPSWTWEKQVCQSACWLNIYENSRLLLARRRHPVIPIAYSDAYSLTARLFSAIFV